MPLVLLGFLAASFLLFFLFGDERDQRGKFFFESPNNKPIIITTTTMAFAPIRESHPKDRNIKATSAESAEVGVPFEQQIWKDGKAESATERAIQYIEQMICANEQKHSSLPHCEPHHKSQISYKPTEADILDLSSFSGMEYIPQHDRMHLLTNIRQFRARCESIKAIQSAKVFQNMKKLKVLDLSHNQLQDHGIPVDMGECLKNSRLETVNLSHNKLSAPMELLRLFKAGSGPVSHTLTRLDISFNVLNGEFPFPLCSALQNLTWLNVSHNMLTSFPRNMYTVMPRLRHLNASYNMLTTRGCIAVAHMIASGTLKYADLSENDIDSFDLPRSSSIPADDWRQRVTATITTSSSDTLSPRISPRISPRRAALDNVSVNLSNNRLRHFPYQFKQCGSFSIALSHNTIHTLDARIRECRGMRSLNLKQNDLREIPDKILSMLDFLMELDLSHNSLLVIPSAIGKMKNLTKLNLQSNNLVNLPAEICALSKLNELNVSNNDLKQLPARIGRLQYLKVLKASSCTLHSIPSSICKLEFLQHVDLQSNRIATLPVQLAEVTSLTYLDVSFNEISALPKQVFDLFNDGNARELVYLPNDPLLNRLGKSMTLSSIERDGGRGRNLSNLLELCCRWIRKYNINMDHNFYNADNIDNDIKQKIKDAQQCNKCGVFFLRRAFHAIFEKTFSPSSKDNDESAKKPPETEARKVSVYYTCCSEICARQILEEEGHYLNVPQSASDKSIPGPWRFSCSICNMFFPNQAVYHQHMLGKKHAKAIRRKEQFGTSATKRFICEVCNIDCPGPEAFEQHLNSTRHKRLSQQIHGHNGFYCDICQVQCTGEEDLLKHKKGKRHMAQLRKQSEHHPQGTDNLDQSKVYGHDIASHISESVKTQTVVGDDMEFSQATVETLASNINPCQNYSQRHVIGSSMEIVSFGSDEGHVSSELTTAETKIETLDDSLPHYCHVCEIQCTGPEDLQKHMTGARHAKRLKKLNPQSPTDQHTAGEPEIPSDIAQEELAPKIPITDWTAPFHREKAVAVYHMIFKKINGYDPNFEIDRSGPDHAPMFTVRSELDGEIVEGRDRTKQKAKAEACYHLCYLLDKKGLLQPHIPQAFKL